MIVEILLRREQCWAHIARVRPRRATGKVVCDPFKGAVLHATRLAYKLAQLMELQHICDQNSIWELKYMKYIITFLYFFIIFFRRESHYENIFFLNVEFFYSQSKIKYFVVPKSPSPLLFHSLQKWYCRHQWAACSCGCWTAGWKGRLDCTSCSSKEAVCCY